MKNLTNRVIPFSFIYTLFLFCCTTLHAGNFTWTGNTSTDWGTPSNWSPSGVPSTNDTITVVTGSNQVHLKTNESVKMITVTSGTVDLKTYSISISATANFNGGTVNNGSVLINSTATTTFKGTSFGAFVQAKSNSILLNGSRFDNGLTVIKKGTSADNSKGGNIYSGKVTIIDSSSGNMVLCDSFPDIYNDEVDIYNASTGTIYLAHRASGTVFHEKVTLNGSGIYSNYYGTATYYRLITINSPNGNIYFGYSTGSCTLGSESTLSMTESSMTSGWLYLRNFYQSDYSQTISIVLAGTARLYLESGSRFNGNFSANAPQVFLNGSKFYGTVNITNGGAANVSSSGGCYFDKEATITNYCSSPITFAMGTSAIDTFMNKVTLKNHVGTFSVNNCIAYGDVKLWNTNTTTSSDRFFIGSSGECRFKDSF